MDNSGSGRGQAEIEPNMTFLDLGDMMITWTLMSMSWLSYGEKRTPVGPGAREPRKDPKLYIQVLELCQKLKRHQQERSQPIWRARFP